MLLYRWKPIQPGLLVNQTQQLINATKKVLKHRGMTYQDLAFKLGLSHSNVRRMFSKGALTLERLEEICEILDISFFELSKLATLPHRNTTIFTLKQELALSKDQKLFSYFYLLASGLSPKAIASRHLFNQDEEMVLLIELDKLELIDLYPGNKVKCHFKTDVKWIKGGPLENKYRLQARKEFWQSNFDGKNEKIYSLFGRFSQSGIEIVKKKVERLLKEIEGLSEEESLYKQEELQDMFFIFAFRPWAFSAVVNYKKEKPRLNN